MGLICRAEHAVGAAAALVLVLDAGGLGNSCTLGSISNVGEILQPGGDHPLTGNKGCHEYIGVLIACCHEVVGRLIVPQVVSAAGGPDGN